MKPDRCKYSSYWSAYKIRVWNPRRLSDQVDLLPSWVFPAYGSAPVFGMCMLANYRDAINMVSFGVN